MINIVDLNYSKNIFPLISQNLINSIEKTISEGKKTLLFLNKRGEANSLICKDCSTQIKCDFCDIGMTVHKYPKKMLICHLCNAEKNIPEKCPKCMSTNLAQVGVGIQKIEENIGKLFSKYKILRLDSDKIKKEGINKDAIKTADLIIATEIINTIAIENLGLVGILLLESEFLISEYNIEEQIYDNIYYNIKRGSNILIQTYIPESNFLKLITEGNYKDFLNYTLAERKQFGYPPFKELAYIWVKSKSKEKVKDIIVKLKNKLEIENNGDFTIFYDKEIFSKKASLFYQKIIIKGDNLQDFLTTIKFEIFRNKEINIEWK
ncbi:hypothetical protein M0P65_02115 [Candidatus Gracilibacteria bacterium]|nr:hypothetical protein [Candidatus Gracilibacteria bacterium]